VVRPSAAASSATQNSATNGAASPAMASSPSEPSRVAASSRDSTGCITAHCTALLNIRTSAAFAISLSARTAASTPAGVSRSSRCGASAVVLMTLTLAPDTDSPAPESLVSTWV
jgi:hypothetical protein